MKRLILAVSILTGCSSQPDFRSFYKTHFTGFDSLPFNYSGPLRNDDPKNLVDELRFMSLSQMDDANLNEYALEVHPWSDSYWPIYQGVIANRFLDPDYHGTVSWVENSKYLSSTVGKIKLEVMSPAEKYDLLLGDSNFTLAKKMIIEGERYQEHLGKVETWMGICHGWAQASYMVERPTKSVTVTAADGRTQIKFLPSDIKALTTLLWSNGSADVKFIGGRCNKTEPPEDSLDRPKDQSCLDNNPGTWHLSIVNQLGVSHRSLIMDASYDYQVWNHPIISYAYRYFNPKTKESFPSFKSAMVALVDFPEDKYKSVRSPEATHLVGVIMNLNYMTETSPSNSETDSSESDRISQTRFVYDLEISENGIILGGEWHENVHPDFLWTPEKGAKAISVGDRTLDYSDDNNAWDGTTGVPKAWQKVGVQASSFGQPLARIVNKLVELSAKGNP